MPPFVNFVNGYFFVFGSTRPIKFPLDLKGRRIFVEHKMRATSTLSLAALVASASAFTLRPGKISRARYLSAGPLSTVEGTHAQPRMFEIEASPTISSQPAAVDCGLLKWILETVLIPYTLVEIFFLMILHQPRCGSTLLGRCVGNVKPCIHDDKQNINNKALG